MIDPNIYKRIRAEVLEPTISTLTGDVYQKAIVDGHTLEINYRYGQKIKKPGFRYLYLKFSIASDSYYLTIN